MSAGLVTVRRDEMARDWVVTCAVCGRLARLGAKGAFWPAKRMAEAHEDIHEEDETPGHRPLVRPPRPGV